MSEYAWQYVVEKFKAHGGTLSTFDFITDIRTAAEYRRLLCDLEKKGYHIIRNKITQKHWNYTLLEASGDQMQIAI